MSSAAAQVYGEVVLRSRWSRAAPARPAAGSDDLPLPNLTRSLAGRARAVEAPASDPLPTGFAAFVRRHPARRVDVDGEAWSVIDTGGAGQAVLVVPGGAGQAEAEFQAIAALEDTFRIVCPTYPLVESMDELVDGLVRLLDELHIDRVHVWGNSFGGMVAQVLVRRAPQRVPTLSLGRTTAPDPRAARRSRVQRRVTETLPSGLVRRLSRLAFARRLRDLDPAERTFWEGFLESEFLPYAKDRMVALAALAADFTARALSADDLQDWQGRVLLLGAPDDRLYGPQLAKLEQLYPTAQRVDLEGGGHVSDHTRIAVEAKLVQRFINEQAP
jgi:pimeloyl-ACP methyl ester carboxylesterase